ncbi:unnamed protein product [Miscanthus lutarioriparius]|uniref:Uncharacterized protein n=1 Tax=Miscanthus lutarioriparius TaxID=422564 RepID=A0A811RTH5_9POAL|nr:unnamed protein product [Miscanthus lutarioriparius]
MSLATSAAAVSTPGVLIHQSTWTLRPLPPAHLRRLLPSGTARPLRVATVRRCLPVTAQSAANPGQEPLSFSFLTKITFWRLRSARIAADCACLAARSFSGYLPESEFYKVEAILRPWRVLHVSSGLLEMGIRGVTVSDVRGFGAQGGSTERHGGSEFSEDMFIAKVKMEIVVCKEQVTGGDKVFVFREGLEFFVRKFWLQPFTPSCRLLFLQLVPERLGFLYLNRSLKAMATNEKFDVRAPLFDGTDYDYSLKARMTNYLKGKSLKLWKITQNATYVIPNEEPIDAHRDRAS